MLAIRLQRTGRRGHAQYRMVVQDARRTPTSGKIVVSLGNYDPHAKTLAIDTEKATYYLSNGAQPSPRVASLLSKEGVKLPSWVKLKTTKERTIKNSDKLRRNRPAEEVVKEAPVAEAVAPSPDEIASVADTDAEAKPQLTDEN